MQRSRWPSREMAGGDLSAQSATRAACQMRLPRLLVVRVLVQPHLAVRIRLLGDHSSVSGQVGLLRMTRLTASPCSRCSLEGSSSLDLPRSRYISRYLPLSRSLERLVLPLSAYISLHLPAPRYISPYLAP